MADNKNKKVLNVPALRLRKSLMFRLCDSQSSVGNGKKNDWTR